MFAGQDLQSMTVCLLVFLGIGGLLVALYVVLQGDRLGAIARLKKLSSPQREVKEYHAFKERLQGFLSKAGTFMLPTRDQVRVRLETRLFQAGVYGPGTMRVFLGVKVVLVLALPLAAMLTFYLTGVLSLSNSLMAGVPAAAVGLIAPEMWLNHCLKKRQSAIRQALPDALDLLVLCLEGGLSLTGSLQRVTEDLEKVHPLLAAEMNIVQRAMQIGSSAGEAVKLFADRCNVEEVRDLSSVLLQSERFGAGVTKALRIHADSCRMERQQRAEEMAQKASVKILFPTLLCIFPAIFIVLLGPAAYQMLELFSKTR